MKAKYTITVEYSGTKTFEVDADHLENFSMNYLFDNPQIIEGMTNPTRDEADSRIIEMRYIKEF